MKFREEFKSHFGNRILCFFEKKKKKLSEFLCSRKVPGSVGERTWPGRHNATGEKSLCHKLFYFVYVVKKL